MPGGGRGSRGGVFSGSSSPRRSYSTSSPNRGSSSSSPPPSSPQQPRPPGLFKQMAATAGGVAAGHVIGSAIVGGVRGSGSQQECVDCQRPPSDQEPCEAELRNFLACTQRESDISVCDGFNTLLKECRRFYESRQK